MTTKWMYAGIAFLAGLFFGQVAARKGWYLPATAAVADIIPTGGA